MNLSTLAVRRLLVTGAAACAAALVPASALAVPGAPAGARVATPACATSGLDVWLDTQGSGAAGTIYYNLEFTNLSGSTCTLFGYPGVSGTDLTGNQLGSPAARVGATPSTVTLANGATATAIVGIVQPGILPPSQCGPVTAAGLRVYPPGQAQARRVPFPFGACSKSGPLYLKIYPVQ
jgi:Protein of unknown function (DUF4232)